MEVILARHHGFCYGVKRAVKMAQDSILLDGSSFTLGPIIHNPQMVERLAEEGVGMINNLTEITSGTIIIRSHGVGPDTYEQAKKTGLNIVDATCPHVKKAQVAAHDLSEAGYQVIIVGEKHHPEVKSIFEWSGKRAIIVETLIEAEKIKNTNKLGIVAQTTFSGSEFKEIVTILLDKSNDIKIDRTICTATEQRQAAAIKLASEVKLMIVIGGKNSANTTRLAELCEAAECKTYHIETAKELHKHWFSGVDKVGITAGASTPDWIIEEVYQKVQDMENLLENTIKKIHPEDVIKGTVVSISKNEVFVDIGYKAEGVISLTELAFPTPENATEIVHVGDEIDVYVVAVDSKSGLQLSKLKADRIFAWDKLETALKEKEKLQGKVIEVVKGGLVLSILGIRGFVPASQVDIRFVEDLSLYIGEVFDVIPIEIDRDKQRVVLSRRLILETERRKKEEEIFATLAIGQVIEGKVKRLVDFGAFVDIGGIDGLVHISDLSWERVKKPDEILQVDDEVSVLVKNFDCKTKRISLSLKEVSRDPWLDKAESLREGSCVKGTIARIMDFGAFVSLENGLEGLIRLNELTEKKVSKVEEIVKLDDQLRVKIIQIDRKVKRIGLSLIQAQQDTERAEYQHYIKEQVETPGTLGDKFGHLFKDFSD